jgi:hypothetical protein
MRFTLEYTVIIMYGITVTVSDLLGRQCDVHWYGNSIIEEYIGCLYIKHKKLKLNNNIKNQRVKNQGIRPNLFIIYINEIVKQKEEKYTARIGILEDM